MKSPIVEAFRFARSQGRFAFIPYLTGGFPDAETCLEILRTLDGSGADLVEIGIPFSDPLADGPTIQLASRMALEAGATPMAVLEIAARARRTMRAPLIIMTYWNPVMRMGPGEFASRAHDAGVSGVIVPDLPPEEAGPWIDAARECALETIFLVAPTTPEKRLGSILSACRGFLYYVSVSGVTGTESTIHEGLLRAVRNLKTVTSLPVAVGFGISTPEQADALAPAADGVVVGSALIREILAHNGSEAQLEAAKRFAKGFVRAPSRTAQTYEGGI